MAGSYTHLDVYKRQEGGIPGRSPGGQPGISLAVVYAYLQSDVK